MNERDMQAYLFEIGELIDEANRYETDLHATIDLVLKIYENNTDDLNNTLLKVELNHLKKAWENRKQFDELRVRLNTIY